MTNPHELSMKIALYILRFCCVLFVINMALTSFLPRSIAKPP